MARKLSKGKTAKLSPRQKKAIQLVQRALLGEMTIEEALKRAGYSDKTARQQKMVMDQIRHNSAMQQALRQAKFTEKFLATTLVGDLKKLRPGQARRQYLELGAKLLDVFPAQRNINTDAKIEDLIKAQEDSTPAA